ncbi:deSI-like protein At4g17486 isoform X1 [Selaginella moellendorffii]|nr:deSI-like protein At4g17486 isoform X1 [Selaginella moellendorffii]XP_024517224.1 deSI-like protein At4g17486 isoform X1 [Selaginella moellendorffii]|eukprot:XP_024517223.1 deSI-like protein At4g17486 isoform X1 [Selaginella moellendorffii]
MDGSPNRQSIVQAVNEGDGKEMRRLSGSFTKRSGKRNPIYLNIYDLTPMNGYLYWFGLGIFHSGIEAHGVEYGFGAHDYPSSGVFEVEPRTCPGFTFRKSVCLGNTRLGAGEFREFIERLANDYNGDSYHLIVKNCNHFTNDACMRLTGLSIPGWVNRLARLAQLCNCLLPDSLQDTTVKKTPEYHSCEDLCLETPQHPSGGKAEIENEQDQLLVATASNASETLMQERLKQVRIVETL